MMQMWLDIREMVREQVEYRDLLVQMTMRDLMLRYKQTIMGVAWAIFMPLMNTAVFSVIFMRLAPIDVGVPYPVFAYCGLVAWNFFASSLRFSVSSLTSNVNLVTKVYFPREIFPFSAVIVCFIDFIVGSLVLFAMMAHYGIGLTPAVFALPVVVAVHIAFTASIALMLAMGNLFYRDVKYLFEIVISMWMFASSVLYPAELLGGRLSLLMRLNPMTPIIDAYRDVLLRGVLPSEAFLATSASTVVMLAAAWILFHRAEFRFAENI
jgi:ABC-type polysaccharide/polyol phosphate export permease